MAINTYATLQTAVANWLNDDQLTSRIPEFISLAEDYIAQVLRVRAMETSADLSIVATSQTVSLPTRYVEMRRVYLDTNPKRVLKYIDPFNFWERYMATETGVPVAFTIEGDNIVLGPYPDGSYTGKILYYQRFAALSSDADTNWLLTSARGLLLYRSLLEASPFLGDDARLITWATLFDDLLEKVQRADRDDRHSGSPRQMRAVNGP